VEVPRDRMMDTIISLGLHATQDRVGNEVVVDIHIPDCLNVVRVFTSIREGTETVRKAGVDAVRVLVGVQSPFTKRFFPTRESVTLKRTAPLSPPDGDRVGAFLRRLHGVLVARVDLARVKPALPCPKCLNPMGWRERKADGKPFLGCCDYQRCKFCMNVPEGY